MTRHDDRRKGRRQRPASAGEFLAAAEEDASREKHRARELRATAWWRKKIASGICHYCGNRVQPAALTMDHLIPLSRGGKSERFNIVAACKECNNRKKNLLPAEWDEYLCSIKKRTL
ncbi:MAG TPA: HNH endonuclease [Spirochaetota bacterium]|nr:HNH endonuclease [Spirochaetota bacterium]